uniref:CENP-V/GFA domain-containing protein n=1 Tax=Globodera pallida TaxID=36090 RepID=A0A183BZB7_GLOPA
MAYSRVPLVAYSKRNNTHDALEVLCKCSSCDHKVHVTHEFMGPGEFSNEFGRYTNIYSSTVLTGINTTAYEALATCSATWGGLVTTTKTASAGRII